MDIEFLKGMMTDKVKGRALELSNDHEALSALINEAVVLDQLLTIKVGLLLEPDVRVIADGYKTLQKKFLLIAVAYVYIADNDRLPETTVFTLKEMAKDFGQKSLEAAKKADAAESGRDALSKLLDD